MTTSWITAEQRAEPRAARARRLSSSDFAEGDVLAGIYRIDAVLGEGGMGIVLRAMHVDLGCQVERPVVLKRVVKGNGRNAWDPRSFGGRL